MELKDYLKSKLPYSDEPIYCIEMNRVAHLIYEEKIDMENTFYDCVVMYCKAHNKELTQESVIECLAFIIEIGLTRHIINNINNFHLYGYGKYKEKRK